MKTPCIGVCKLKNGICIGCGRTKAEIQQWSALTEQQQEIKILQIRGVRYTHTCPQCQQPTYCGCKAEDETCWCFDLDVKKVETRKQTSHNQCLCRQCLAKRPSL
ncbi:TPA: DUF1289 domain-containing protein [Photobacterium damselae]